MILTTLLMSVMSLAKAENIVIIGDSLTCGPFGAYLLQDLTKKGNQINLYCAVSSAPSHWLTGKSPSGQQCKTMSSADSKLALCADHGKTPTLASLLIKHKNAKFIIGLGTNSLLSPSADASYQKMAKTVKASGNPCTWIGPPHLNLKQVKGFAPNRISKEEKNLNSFYDSMATSIDGSCNLIDSRDATISGSPGNQTTDGIHRTDEAGKHWVQQISPSILGEAIQTTEHRPSAK